jgi:hypothetical protein
MIIEMMSLVLDDNDLSWGEQNAIEWLRSLTAPR